MMMRLGDRLGYNQTKPSKKEKKRRKTEITFL